MFKIIKRAEADKNERTSFNKRRDKNERKKSIASEKLVNKGF